MTIEEKDFTLEYNDTNSKFDLYLLHVVNAKDETKRREELKIEGYGMSLESCFRNIINYRIDKNHEILSLKEYIEEYRKEKDELMRVLVKDLHATE